nr:DNA fragmentation factor subunit beta [Aotus nancymaae]
MLQKPKTVKLRALRSPRKFGVAGRSCREVLRKGCLSFQLPERGSRLCLYEDGTELTEDYFPSIPDDTELVLLTSGQAWQGCEWQGPWRWAGSWHSRGSWGLGPGVPVGMAKGPPYSELSGLKEEALWSQSWSASLRRQSPQSSRSCTQLLGCLFLQKNLLIGRARWLSPVGRKREVQEERPCGHVRGCSVGGSAVSTEGWRFWWSRRAVEWDGLRAGAGFRAPCARLSALPWFLQVSSYPSMVGAEAQEEFLRVLDSMCQKLRSVQYNGSYFDRGAKGGSRLCTPEGWFSCQGPFDMDGCLSRHSINPYSNRESRILFGTWNLDHVIEKKRAIIPTLVEAVKEQDGREVDWEYFYGLLFTSENLKLVHVVCHKKTTHKLSCDPNRIYKRQTRLKRKRPARKRQ